MKDFEVTVRLRNNQLKARRTALGMTQHQLAAAAGVCRASYSELERLRASPTFAHDGTAKKGRHKGDWRPIALRLAEFHECLPEDLFPESIQRVKKTEIVATFDFEQLPLAAAHSVPALLPSPEDELAAKETRAQIEEALGLLPSREAQCLRLRYGLEGSACLSYAEIGEKFGVSGNRAREIEQQALHRLRYPSLANVVTGVLSPRELDAGRAAEYFKAAQVLDGEADKMSRSAYWSEENGRYRKWNEERFCYETPSEADIRVSRMLVQVEEKRKEAAELRDKATSARQAAEEIMSKWQK